jgi:NAD(P)-dependent dehydrogenase (short-subunit alcohol dehydrogenase family)
VASGSELTGVLDAIPTDVTDEASVRSLFETTVQRYGRVDLLFNNAGTGAPLGQYRCPRTRGLEQGARRQPDWRLSLHPGGVPGHAPATAPGRPHHQQRIDIRTRSTPRSIAYTASKHAITGLTKSTALDGRAFDIACGQIDIGNAATDLGSGAASGVAQADGTVRPEPLMDVAEVGRAVRYMADLPLDANVATMTVMPTKMPFIGRG